MESIGDDNYTSGSQNQPSLGPQLRNESHGKGRKTTLEVRFYIQEVKDTFHDQEYKYDMFVGVMKDFKANRIGTATAIERVKELLKDHNDLVIGFNTYLPPGYEITLDHEEDEATSTTT